MHGIFSKGIVAWNRLCHQTIANEHSKLCAWRIEERRRLYNNNFVWNVKVEFESRNPKVFLLSQLFMATKFFVRISSVCRIALHCIAFFASLVYVKWHFICEKLHTKWYCTKYSMSLRAQSHIQLRKFWNWNALSCICWIQCTFKNLLITEAKANSAWKISRIEFNLSSFHVCIKRIHFTIFPPTKANYFIEQTILPWISVQKHSQMCFIVLIFWMAFICHGIAINICF